MRVLVLGAGFGGLELTTRLSDEFSEAVEITLIDQSDAFVFGFSKLDVMFGRTAPAAVRHAYRDIVKPGVTFVQTTVRSIDPTARRVETDAGAFECDTLVVALGADLDPAATPGLAEAGHDFYSVDGRVRDPRRARGLRGRPCDRRRPLDAVQMPAGSPETALMLHDQLVKRGLRDRSEIALVVDFGRPIPPSPEASALLEGTFAERGIAWHPRQEVSELDPSTKIAKLRDGGELPFDLFLAVPVHRAPEVVLESGMTVDGWIPVNPLTLETTFDGVYAVGDVAAVGTPRAGVFAEGQAAVAARANRRSHQGREQRRGVRRTRHLLHGVRRRPGRARRRHLLRRQARRPTRRSVGGVHGRQDRVRLEPDQALVRSRLDSHPNGVAHLHPCRSRHLEGQRLMPAATRNGGTRRVASETPGLDDCAYP